MLYFVFSLLSKIKIKITLTEKKGYKVFDKKDKFLTTQKKNSTTQFQIKKILES